MVTISRSVVATDAPLVGRANEQERIADLLETAPVHGHALLIVGEPGIGKTALLQKAAGDALASGFTLLTATGVEFEADLTFSGLQQLLLPINDLLVELPTAQRDILQGALGQSSAAPSNTLQVATATLAALQGACNKRPLLVIVDDLQWLDRASALVLAMVARRLEQTRVALLCAGRAGHSEMMSEAGVPELALPPLELSAAAQLLDDRFPVLAPRTRHRLLDEAQGNPLALLHLPAALTPEQRSARAAVPSVLPLTGRLQQAFASRYADLPRDTRRLLLLAALAGSSRLDALFGGRVTEQELGRLEAAQEHQLIRVDAPHGTITFTHPLIRAAVAGAATAAEVRRAQLALGQLADDPDRRAWHLAAATLQPDETIAALLEETGNRSLHRGDPAGALNAILRAAELSPIGQSRGSRLARAAHIGAYITGDLQVSDLLQKVHQPDLQASAVLYAAAAAAVVLVNGDSEIATPHRILTEAIREHAGDYQSSDEALVAALTALNFVCFVGGRPEAWTPYAAAVDRLLPAPPPELYLLSTTFADPVHRGPSALDMLTEAIASLDDETEQWRIANIATAAVIIDRLAGCRAALATLVGTDRETRATPLALTGINHLARDHFLSGEWDDASKLCTEGLELCEHLAQPMLAFPLHGHVGVIAALRGNYADASKAVDAITRWATPRGAWGALHLTGYIRTVLEMSRASYDAAYQAAASLSPPGTFTPYSPQALYVCLDLVESAVRTGRTADARSHVAAIQRAGVSALSSRLALLAAGAGALVADNDKATELYREALAAPDSRRWPFDRARVQLNYGEHLRRNHGSTVHARHQLTEALDTFTRLGARPWAARAATELRAAGSALPPARTDQLSPLTPQEYEIATLAATGMTNKEIAQRVFLSDRTVGAHLYRTFPKLGITKRAGLRDALTAYNAAGAG